MGLFFFFFFWLVAFSVRTKYFGEAPTSRSLGLCLVLFVLFPKKSPPMSCVKVGTQWSKSNQSGVRAIQPSYPCVPWEEVRNFWDLTGLFVDFDSVFLFSVWCLRPFLSCVSESSPLRFLSGRGATSCLCGVEEEIWLLLSNIFNQVSLCAWAHSFLPHLLPHSKPVWGSASCLAHSLLPCFALSESLAWRVPH